MATKRELIDDAYDQVGIGTYEFNLPPDQINTALRRLNGMLRRWDAAGVRIGSNINAGLNDESGVRPPYEDAVVFNLALTLKNSIGANPKPDLAKTARQAYNDMLSALSQIDPYQIPNTMPLGRGNRRMTLDRQFFTEQDPLQTGPDGELLF